MLNQKFTHPSLPTRLKKRLKDPDSTRIGLISNNKVLFCGCRATVVLQSDDALKTLVVQVLNYFVGYVLWKNVFSGYKYVL